MRISYQSARERKNKGIAQSAENSGEEWGNYAKDFLKAYLKNHPRMHVDSLWLAGLEEPTSPRALGAVIQYAKKEGWIRYITREGGIVASPSTASNLTLKAIWHSCLYKK